MDAVLTQAQPLKGRATAHTSPAQPKHFAIPVGSGQRVSITRPIPVEATHDRTGHTATAVPFGIKVTRSNLREALLALQLHLEWAFVDFSLAPGEMLAQSDARALQAMAGYLALPGDDSHGLTLSDRVAFNSLPKEEKALILERQARLRPAEWDEDDG